MMQLVAVLLASKAVFFGEVAVAQGEEHQPVIGEMIVQSVPAKNYLQGGFETKFKGMGELVGKTLNELFHAAKEEKIGLHGPVVHCFFGAPHREPEKQFKMETGFYVRKGSPVVGKFRVRKLPEYRCATILYVGPSAHIGDAWQQLYRSVKSQGLKPTDEERELYLYWEGADSPNNIVQVQVGVK